MKFFATAALIASVNAVCGDGEDITCDPATNNCLLRVSIDVGSTKGKDYKAFVKADKTGELGGTKYMCATPEETKGFLETSG